MDNRDTPALEVGPDTPYGTALPDRCLYCDSPDMSRGRITGRCLSCGQRYIMSIGQYSTHEGSTTMTYSYRTTPPARTITPPSADTLPDVLHYPSRSGGPGHDVSVHITRQAGGAFRPGAVYVTCTCTGARYRSFIGTVAYPGCWAMVAARRTLGLSAIGPNGYSAMRG